MDGDKKIKGIVFAGIITLAITACKVQPSGYVSLYVDNLTSVNDTVDPGETPLNIKNPAMSHEVDTTAVIEPELHVLLHPAEEMSKISQDNAYQHEVKELLKIIADSIRLLSQQVNELQNQPAFKPDSNFLAKRIHKVQPSESFQTDYKTTQLLQAKNDTIALLRKQVGEFQNKGSIKTDTIYGFKETAKLPVEERQQPDSMTFQLIKAKDEQIQMLQDQLNALQAAADRTPQQAQITREPAQAQPLGSQQTDHSTRQLLMAKDEQIQMLQDQLSAMQATAARTSRQTRPAGSQQADSMTLQLLQARKDTILFLRDQLNNLQLFVDQKDTFDIEKKTIEMQPEKEHVTSQKTINFNEAVQDSIRLLKELVLSLKEQIMADKDTITLARNDEKDVSYKAVTDTTLLVAYYELGEIKPLDEDTILQQIIELCKNNKVIKITLSGYTDSSGNELTNKKITDKRLNYLYENIIPWIAREQVFFQNFGDTYASDLVVTNERRIEIRIYKK